tara:strand:- start:3255 stop:3818 length:564 start_codon:yes stop_codon:yes gene_type:complete
MFKLFIILFSLLLSEEDMLPNTFLKDLDNNKRDIYEFLENGPVVINFWFLACEPCKKEMVYLDEFNIKYAKYGFKVVSVNIDNSRTFNRVEPFVNSKKYSFTVLSDPKSLFFRKVGARICPYLLVIDQDGKIIHRHSGYNPGDEIKLEKEIVSLIMPQLKADTTLVDTTIIKLIQSETLEEDIPDNQ